MIVMLTVVLLVAAEFLLGFLVYQSQLSGIESEYSVVAQLNVKSSKSQFAKICDGYLDEIKTEGLDALGAKYGYAGTYSEERLTLTDTSGVGYNGEKVLNIPKSTPINTRITSAAKTVSIHQIGDILGGSTTTEYVLLSAQRGVVYDILLIEMGTFAANIDETFFDGYVISASTGRVCNTNISGVSGNIATSFGVNLVADITTITGKLAGTEYYATSVALDYTNISAKEGESVGQFYYVGLTSADVVNAVIAQSLGQLAVIIVVFCVLIFALIAGLIFFLLALRRNKLNARTFNAESYMLTIDDCGEIIKCSNNFKKFGSPNIFDAAVSKNNDVNYVLGSSVACVFQAEDGQRIVNFLVVDTSDDIKMIGIDITDSNSSEIVSLAGNDVSIKHGFKNKYTKAITVGTPRILLGILSIDNLKNLQLMYGSKLTEDVSGEIERRITENAGHVSPLSADQKAVMFTVEKDIETFLAKIKACFNELNKPVLSDDSLVTVNVLGGFVNVDENTTDKSFSTTHACALAALRRAKQADSGPKYFVYHESNRKQYDRYFDYSFDIEKMLKDWQFEMQYQPQYSVKHKKITAFESLLRVKETQKLNVDIGQLINYIQDVGQMNTVGKYTFEETLGFAKEIERFKVSISVNVSPLQFMQVGFVSYFVDLMGSYQLNPELIDVEITETFLVGNISEAARKISELKKHGIGVHLDDFGKEYSSLNYLNQMPVETLKIDRDFIVGITKSEKNRTLVQSIIEMAHKLGVTTIAEGVETEEQFKMLCGMNCDLIQGYYIGKAMSASKVKELLNGQND